MPSSLRRPGSRDNGSPRALGDGNGRGAAPLRLPRFVLYVEGPRDQSVLAAWARRVSPALARALADVTVILGGCQPARAAGHFRDVRGQHPEARGLVVLDRDADGAPRPRAVPEPGLEYFTWARRHIESYLLVPEAIRRSLRLPPDDARIERFFRAAMPSDEVGLGTIDAKRLFAVRGQLEQLVGRTVRPAAVARAMRTEELHRDALDLLARLREALDLGDLRAALRASRAE